ncbi:MAG TPA: hypothetical protein VKF59_17130, partial [Candidatus Dormibacteraeota bacterium]|nr:hypothetical protein [Candidatus Dormibacteraeota bacterium]
AEAGSLSLGELVAPELRERVRGLAGVLGPGPHEPWNARVQQTAWEYAREWVQARREEAQEVRRGIEVLAASPAFAESDVRPARADLEVLDDALAACDLAAGARAGLEALLGAVADPVPLLAAAGRTGALARFLRVELRAFETAVEYASHPDLVIPDGPELPRLAALRREALEVAGQVLALAAEDRAREAFSALERFRQAYAAAYEEAHRAFYAAAGDEVARSVRSSPAYQALAALAEVGAAAVPDDRVKVDRALAASTVEPCRRRVESELAWRPVCGCGFHLGDRPPALDAAALVTMAARGVAEHLEELGREETRARLQRAADDLASLDRSETASDLQRLLAVAAAPDRAEPVALVHLLRPELRATLREVLSGRQLVVRRDLAQLREDLIGRRYPRRRLLELVQAWIDGSGAGEPPPERAFVEVVDSGEAAAGAARPAAEDEPATAAFLRARWPRLAGELPEHRPSDAFWLAAWWRDRPARPDWVPPGLAADEELAAAARAAAEDPAAGRDLAELDARIGPRTLLGDQVEGALDLAARDGAGLAGALLAERLLRHPVRLAASALVRRLGADLQLVERVPAGALDRLASEHALLDPRELRSLALLLEAGGCLARLERRLAGLTVPELVQEVYPECLAPVADLVSQAELALAGTSLVDADAVAAFASAAGRLRHAAETVFESAAASGFAGCLRVWEVAAEVIEPLLSEHGRVAVLVVDAMRADLWLRLRDVLWKALPERRLGERWAVVPAPTRTAEAMASLFLGRAVPEGSLAAGDPVPPFPGLGYAARLLAGADRDGEAQRLRDLWGSGPPLSVAVATGVDERLHHTPVELAGLLDEAVAALSRRVVPTLQTLPPQVPLVVLADHGFRENPAWGREARYAHGGLSLEESVVPVAVLTRAGTPRR